MHMNNIKSQPRELSLDEIEHVSGAGTPPTPEQYGCNFHDPNSIACEDYYFAELEYAQTGTHMLDPDPFRLSSGGSDSGSNKGAPNLYKQADKLERTADNIQTFGAVFAGGIGIFNALSGLAVGTSTQFMGKYLKAQAAENRRLANDLRSIFEEPNVGP